jgi:microcystin-dependent protein
VNTALGLKADSLSVNTALGLKADSLSVNTALGLKADELFVSSELEKKADSVSVNDALELNKVGILSVSSELQLKAATLSVNTSLATLESSKASVNALTSGLASKADITYVHDEIADALSQGGYHNSIEILTGSLSDSFIVNTDNVTGEIEAYASLAMDVTGIVATDTKRSPRFLSDSSIQADSDWSNGGFIASTNNGTPYTAFDRTLSTFWGTGGGTFNTTTGSAIPSSGYWLQMKYPASYLLKYYTLFNYGDGTATANPPSVWSIQGSNDGTTFTTVQTYTKTNWVNDTTYTFEVLTDHIPYMYWRLLVTKIDVWIASRERCTIGEWTLYTGWTIGDIKVKSVYSLDYNTFKIVLADAAGIPVDMTNTPLVAWFFNIMLTKGGKLCCSGYYKFTRSGTALVITKLSPSAATISIMTALGEGPPDEAVVPAPVGTIIMFGGLSAPAGYLLCDGTAVSRTTYAPLYLKIGTIWGAGNGTTTFNLPDLRDRFPRCTGTTAGEVGTRKPDTIKSHTHGASSALAGAHGHTSTLAAAGTHSHTASSADAGAHTVSTATVSSLGDPFGNQAGVSWISLATQSTGQKTLASVPNHAHGITVNSGGSHTHSLTINSAAAHTHAIAVDATGDAIETRPMCATVMFCIKH